MIGILIAFPQLVTHYRGGGFDGNLDDLGLPDLNLPDLDLD